MELECPVVGCTLGENGGRYKTPPVPEALQLQLLMMHNQNHVQAQGVAVEHDAGGARVGCKAEKVPRPVLKKGQSEDKYKFCGKRSHEIPPNSKVCGQS